MIGTVLHRTTKELRSGVRTELFDSALWIIEPDLSAVPGVAFCFWKIDGDAITEMTDGAERSAAEAAILPGIRYRRIMKIRDSEIAYLTKHYDDKVQASFLAFWTEGVSRGWPNRVALVQSVLDWVKTVMTEFFARKNAIVAATTLPAVDAISEDFSAFDATDPHISVQQVLETID